MSMNNQGRPSDAGEAFPAGIATISGDRGLDHDHAAFGQVKPGQRLTGGYGLTGVHQHFRYFQARPVRPDRGLVFRNQDAGDFDDRRKALFRRLEHGNGRALRSTGLVVGETWLRDEAKPRQHCGREFS